MSGTRFPFYTTNESDFIDALKKFNLRATDYLSKVSVITQSKLDQSTVLATSLSALSFELNLIRDYSQGLTAAKNILLYGPAGTPPVTWTAPPVITLPEAPVPGDAISWLNSWITQIKADTGYTPAIGSDLGTEPPTQPSISPDSAQPLLRNPVTFPGGHARFDWVKAGFDGIAIECQRGDETVWTPLGMDDRSPYDDVRPLKVSGQPEERRYRARYLRGFTPVGQWSDVLSLTVG